MSKKFPDVKISYRSIYDLASQSSIKTKLLLSGINLGVFDIISDWQTPEEVAKSIETHPENTEAFLDALTSIDLLEKSNGRYKNTEMSNTFLVTSNPAYIGGFINVLETFNIPTAEMMIELIKNGPPPPDPNADIGDMELWKQIHRSAGTVQRAGFGQELAKIISKFPEFPNMKKMLDLGGGAGLVGMCIVDSHPTMEGVIYDQPPVVQVADDFIKEYEMESRIKTIGGNYMTDSVGENYDLILASQTLGFAGNQVDDIIKKLYDSLNPGGILITLHDGLTNEKTKPPSIILPFLGMALRGQASEIRLFEEGETGHSMLRMGFRSVHRFPLAMGSGDLEMTIGRK
jgi:predicted O-methyltransferase YrrM